MKLFAGLDNPFQVWMSHGDKLSALPSGFFDIGATKNAEHAAIACQRPCDVRYSFHPEVTHTPRSRALKNFVCGVCNAKADWFMGSFVNEAIARIREQVGETGHVIGAVSGGVDSSVAAVLLNRAIGNRFHAVLVDNGVLRLNEAAEVMERLGRCWNRSDTGGRVGAVPVEAERRVRSGAEAKDHWYDVHRRKCEGEL